MKDATQQLLFNCSTSNLSEYLLVAHLSENVRQKVMTEKQHFFTQYHTPVAIATKPYLTVAVFSAKEAMEATLLKWLHRIISTQNSFSVALNNYGGFPPHTVYLRVQEHAPFKQLATSLKVVNQYVQSNDCPPMKLVTHPHVSLARMLPPPIFEKAMLAYAHKEFYDSFPLTELVLLRRQHAYDSCKQVSIFHLQTSVKTFN